MRPLLNLLLMLLVVSTTSAETCFQIHGRAVLYRGDGFFAIWHVGTDHLFMPADKQSADLVCRYFDCENGDKQPALFADFIVCPTEKYWQGAAQRVIVKKVEHPVVVPEWPPEKTRGKPDSN